MAEKLYKSQCQYHGMNCYVGKLHTAKYDDRKMRSKARRLRRKREERQAMIEVRRYGQCL